MFTLKGTCVGQIPLLGGCEHQIQAILLRETYIKRTLQVPPEAIFMTLWHCHLL